MAGWHEDDEQILLEHLDDFQDCLSMTRLLTVLLQSKTLSKVDADEVRLYF
jgi:hypothetical protein